MEVTMVKEWPETEETMPQTPTDCLGCTGCLLPITLQEANEGCPYCGKQHQYDQIDRDHYQEGGE